MNALVLLLAASPAADPTIDAAFFENKVRPLLVAQCLGCHDAKKEKGGLQLTSRAAMLRGGDTGPAVAPGNADKSQLVKAVRYADDLKMPPKGKLKAEEIEVLAAWVNGGAPWPEATPAAAAAAKEFDVKARAAGHWAYQPVKPPPPPAVQNTSWPRGDIDRFILAKLEAAGLKPAAAAGKAALVRRLYFDVLGLPPTQEELTAALGMSHERLVDTLLVSPHYGERLGRHWLDLARYAETQGHEFDFEIPDAWRYRDYVIRALNADVPFDRFVQEHVAGDLLPDPRRSADGTNESLFGTGFWVLGEGKHSPVDVRQEQADRLDNMIDVFGKAFLATTISCARCHDHKFDAVSARDYYGLYGVLSSSRYRRAFPAAAKAGPVVVPGLLGDWLADGPAFAGGGPAHSGRGGENIAGALRSPTFTIGTKFVAVRVAGKGAKLRLVVDGHQLIQDPIYGGLARGVDHGAVFRWINIDVAMWPGRAAYLELLDDGPGFFAVDEVRLTDVPPTDKPSPCPPPAADAKTAAPPRAPALVEGTGRDERVFVRGNHKTLGIAAPRRLPDFLPGPAASPAAGSGRLEIAHALTDPTNPLVARVIVNRVWQHHFGVGLSPTPDDFGRQGTPPTHPELLDHLAAGFVADGWSLKRLHRRILLSAAYQLGGKPHSDTAELAATADAQNRLFHKANLRRLDAEAIRDAVLCVSGRLDRTAGGPGIPPHLTDHMVGRGRPGQSGPLDGAGRRSVYQQVRRNFLNPMFAAFDFPTPFTAIGRRTSSNVPAQALVMLNNPFVRQQAEMWAKRDAAAEPAERVRRMFVAAFARTPTADEAAAATAFAADQGWPALAHALFNAKEFVFVE